uniref:Uncharacterized protein n=1 Tax=Lepeophtheirus salmonis TaxID=72036 RepID=A0A0K2SXP1_LEPSM
MLKADFDVDFEENKSDVHSLMVVLFKLFSVLLSSNAPTMIGYISFATS